MTLDTQETAQQELVYITNLEEDLQNNGTKMNEEKGPKDKKPAVKNRPFERPSQVNLNHGSKIYEESGSENENVEEDKKGENKKNMKESTYANISSYERGKQAKQWKIEKPKNNHDIPRNEEEMRKLLSPRKRPFPIWGRTFL